MRFVVVGVATTGIHLAVELSLFNFAKFTTIFANACAFIVATLFSFVLNTFWSFSSNLALGIFARYLIVSFFGLVVSVSIAGLSELIGLNNLQGTIMVILILPIASFMLHNYWTYR